MADPSDFAYRAPGGAAYGPGGGWAPEGSPGIAFMRNPQADRAAADKRAAEASEAARAATRRRFLFGRNPVLGASDDELAGRQSEIDSSNREVGKIDDFQRRMGGSR